MKKDLDPIENEELEELDPDFVETEDTPDPKKDIEDKDLEKSLTIKQALFCKCYVSTEEFFCNWVRSYAKAYNISLELEPNKYKAVQTCATRLLTNVIINRYIHLLLETWISDAGIDKQLAMLCIQNEDKRIKLDAIKEVNKLRGRIIDRISDVNDENPLEDFNSQVKK